MAEPCAKQARIERVCEFAKFTPVQLLEETEKAVGDPQLPIQQRAPIGKSCELKNIQLSVERNGETLNQWRALNAELEKDVERVRQREELLTKVESMKEITLTEVWHEEG
ncbi:structural maintenance of chromosomes protein 5 [Quercus suber]|uniref:Structural maintenance of chromosomes protein 5 n=1 Tax=Quercus suber TaxID=58331 RepID=A0AAW0LR90_QUESU|nr:structural maintenance of chromosomes protein 5 [Quercus suber]